MGIFSVTSPNNRLGFVFQSLEGNVNITRPVTNPLRNSAGIKQFNADIRKWGNTTNFILRAVVTSRLTKGKKGNHLYLSGIHKGKTERKLSESLKASFKNEDGGASIEVVKFNLERHGVFVQKGVGNGYPISGKSTDPNAKNRSFGNRTPKDWYNKTLESNSSKLSNILVRNHGSAIVANVKHSFIK